MDAPFDASTPCFHPKRGAHNFCLPPHPLPRQTPDIIFLFQHLSVHQMGTKLGPHTCWATNTHALLCVCVCVGAHTSMTHVDARKSLAAGSGFLAAVYMRTKQCPAPTKPAN